ncbi:hypothetical protein [Vibrio panuliri]|uniref:Uncharacterized protein n=1 Tax=Vibrio panuliri TaxID=1381081 RepID=A0A1Q9HP86_9VIBR|nr:hypothetical protein [Vibrio panuliri]KAB1455110.1 hypothetical protein F7O85_19910 [Vibrio panuliri]OLQ92667.1 hypothetical protein BIY22_15195 [Vibrio panuliri]OLQ94838.1 hypothetical protein BIY20_00670 [Vibrio panuliri]
MNVRNLFAIAITSFTLSNSVSAAYMPSPTQAKGDRVRIKGESGIEIDAEYAPDMTVQFGTSYGNGLSKDNHHDYHRNSNRKRDEAAIYVQAVVPITFGQRNKPDPNRLYEMELQNRNLQIETLKAELQLMKAAMHAGSVSQNNFDEDMAIE